MKCYLKPLRYSLYLVVLLAVSGCSNNVVPSYSAVNLVKNVAQHFVIAALRSIPNSQTKSTTLVSEVGGAASTTASAQIKHDYSFALQLASVSSESGLAVTFNKMLKRAPNIFQGSPILNVEVADVNEKIFYRLKFGGYKYLKNAKADCEAIKRQGIDCWVSNYTDNRVYF